MIKETIAGTNNYDISCLNNVSGDEKAVVIISHGFGSSKGSPTALALMERLPAHGIGVFSYDFPGHGESPADGEMFRIENCLKDLASVEAHVSSLAPDGEIMYFSSSFGAYINLLYLALQQHAGTKSFLRAAAVSMPKIFKDAETPEYAEQLKNQGFIILGSDSPRPLKIPKEFCDDLEAHDVFDLYKPGRTKIAMIHGDADETAPFEDAKGFAAKYGAEFTVVKGGFHNLMESGQLDLVLETAIRFFQR